MAFLSPRALRSKAGDAVVIRCAVADDAAALLVHARTVVGESEFMVSCPEEFDLTEEQERAWIGKSAKAPDRILLVAEISGGIVGTLFFESGLRKRLAHRGTLHMSIMQQWRGRGIGTALLQTLIDWAQEHPVIEKLCLSVFVTNSRAIALYRKCGFVEEGRRIREIKLGPGTYVDDILMYRFV